MNKQLEGLKVAILCDTGFEQNEMTEPRKALDEAGAKTVLISPVYGKIRGWIDDQWRDEFPVDLDLNNANPDDFDALHLPGGVINPDKLRRFDSAIAFIKAFVDAKKPIAAICHGPWTLINANGVRGKVLTSWPSIKIDLENAGAKWVDKPVVRDGLLVTSRWPADIPMYNPVMIEMFAEALRKK